MTTEYVDYLILGDEHHGEIHRDVKTRRLAVRAKYAPMKEQVRMVDYHVHEYPAQDGRFYLIASNRPLSDFDVEEALLNSRIHPLRG